jgi:hypothetical protein
MDALPPARQHQLLADAEHRVRTQLDRLQEAAERLRNGDLYRFMNRRGAVLAMAARLEWLREVGEALAKTRGH